MSSADTSGKAAAGRTRYFIRFGNIPDGDKSRMWTAPNAYMNGRIGQKLAGLSAYDAKQERGKWVLNTDDINVGAGIASLSELFYRAVTEPDENKVYLLKGVATTWKNMTPQERKDFADLYPGKGCERFDILGTDGEPLVRDFNVISEVKVTDLVCQMISFPEDWHDELSKLEQQETLEPTPVFGGLG